MEASNKPSLTKKKDPITKMESKVEKKMSKDEIQTLISSLPKEDGWASSDDIFLCKYKGFWYYPTIIENMLSGLDSPCSPNHTLVCSPPKSGTTWLKALVFAIATRTRYHSLQESPLSSTFSQHLIPYIEHHSSVAGHGSVDLQLLSTHLPYPSLPNSIMDSDCKIIYICRDPKDAFISLWHFAHKVMPNKDSAEPIPLDQAFDLFCRGVSNYGSYWDNVLGYWKANLDRPGQVLFLKYGDMMSDPVLYLNRIAEFMNYPFSTEEVTQGEDVKIVQACSFESMSKIKASSLMMIKASNQESNVLSTDIFFRKGKVGDWKNYLTQEMANRIDEITATKLGPFGLQL